MNISEDALLEAGYKRCPTEGMALNKHADCLFQKRIRDEIGNTLYFIDIWQYKHARQEGGDGWMPEVQLYLPPEHAKTINLDLGGFTTIEHVERFIARAYQALGCEPYETA